jgi:hypothetical protein
VDHGYIGKQQMLTCPPTVAFRLYLHIADTAYAVKCNSYHVGCTVL